MRALLTIFTKDLRLRLRDRSALVIAFVAPIGLATIIGLAFGNPASAFHATYAVADADGGDLSRIFRTDVLEGLGEGITVVDADSAPEARELVTEEDADAAFIIPEGFERDVFGGRPAEIHVTRSAGAEISGEIATAVAEAFTAQLTASRLSIATALRSPGGPGLDAIAELGQEAGRDRIPVELHDAGAGSTGEVTSLSYFGPGMALFFLYFTVGFAGRSLLSEREEGTLARLRAAPVGWTSVVAGKSLVAFVLGLASLAVMFGFLGSVFGAEFGDPVAVAVLSVATVVSLLGVMAIVQLLARTQQQAENFGSVIAISFALVGGSFFQLHALPDVMQTLSYGTPNGWAMRGYTALVYDGARMTDILPNIAALCAIAAGTGGVAVLLARRVVRT